LLFRKVGLRKFQVGAALGSSAGSRNRICAAGIEVG